MVVYKHPEGIPTGVPDNNNRQEYKKMIYNINDLEEHINALANTFGLIADAHGYSTDQLISIRNAVVEERGKYDVDWKEDPEEKLAFDYYYCIEMLGVVQRENDLSPKRRLRLFRMATMNDDVKKIWDLDPYWDPKAFLNDEQWEERIWEPRWKKKKWSKK